MPGVPAAFRGEHRLACLLRSKKFREANAAKSSQAKRLNKHLKADLARITKSHDVLLERLRQIYIVRDLDNAHDKLQAGQFAARTVPLACQITAEEAELIRAARVALGFTKGMFLREAAIFYAMWAVDQHNRQKLSGRDLQEAVGLRADIDTDVEAWRQFTRAAAE